MRVDLRALGVKVNLEDEVELTYFFLENLDMFEVLKEILNLLRGQGEITLYMCRDYEKGVKYPAICFRTPADTRDLVVNLIREFGGYVENGMLVVEEK